MRNSVVHQETRLSNNMGPRPSSRGGPTRGRDPRDREDPDWWDAWRASRTEAYEASKPLHLALLAGWLVLLAFAVRGREPWLVAALSIALIPVTAELTCYYYAFVLALAVVSEKRPSAGFLLLGLCALSLFVSLAPVPGMPTWEDQHYALLSALTTVAFALILVGFARGSRVGTG